MREGLALDLRDQRVERAAYPPGPSLAATTSDVRPRVVSFVRMVLTF
jgi:hypothetical protein